MKYLMEQNMFPAKAIEKNETHILCPVHSFQSIKFLSIRFTVFEISKDGTIIYILACIVNTQMVFEHMRRLPNSQQLFSQHTWQL